MVGGIMEHGRKCNCKECLDAMREDMQPECPECCRRIGRVGGWCPDCSDPISSDSWDDEGCAGPIGCEPDEVEP